MHRTIATLILFQLFVADPYLRGSPPGHAPSIAKAEMSSVKNLDVQCREDGMGVTIEFDSPFKGVIFSKGHFNERGCVYAQNVNRNKVTFTIRADQCGTVVGTRGGNSVDSNRVKRQAEGERAVPGAGENVLKEQAEKDTNLNGRLFAPQEKPGMGEHHSALNGVQNYDDSAFYGGDDQFNMPQFNPQFGGAGDGFGNMFGQGSFSPDNIRQESMGSLDFQPPNESQRSMPFLNQLQGRQNLPQFGMPQFGGAQGGPMPPMDFGFGGQPNMTGGPMGGFPGMGGFPEMGGFPQPQQNGTAAPGMFADPFGAGMANMAIGPGGGAQSPFGVYQPNPSNVMNQNQVPGTGLHNTQIGQVQNFDDSRFYNFEDNEPKQNFQPNVPTPANIAAEPLSNIDTNQFNPSGLSGRLGPNLGLQNAVDPVFSHFSQQSDNPGLDLSGTPQALSGAQQFPGMNANIQPPSQVPSGPAQDPFMMKHFENLANANQGFSPGQDSHAQSVLNLNPGDLASKADGINRKIIDGVRRGQQGANAGAPSPDHIFRISQPPNQGNNAPDPSLAANVAPPNFMGNIMENARQKSGQAPNPTPGFPPERLQASDGNSLNSYDFGAAPQFNYDSNPAFDFEGQVSAFPNFGSNLESQQNQLATSPHGSLPGWGSPDSMSVGNDGTSAYPSFPGMGGDSFGLPSGDNFGLPGGDDFTLPSQPPTPQYDMGMNLNLGLEQPKPSVSSVFGGQQQRQQQKSLFGRAPVRNENPPDAEYIENIIIIQNDPDVQEVWDTARAIRCEWRTNYRKVVSTKQRAAMTEVQTMRFAGDDVEVWMEIQSGKGPWADPVANIVPIGHTMTLLIGANDKKSEFDLRVGKCRAHDGVRTPIFLTDRDGCVLKSKLMSPFMKANNWGPHSSTIAFAHFSAFKFPETTNVYIECDVEVCKHGCRDMCPSSKPQIVDAADLQREELSRKRRDTEGVEKVGSVKGRFQALSPTEFSFDPRDLPTDLESVVADEFQEVESEVRDAFCVSRQGLALGLGLSVSAIMCSLLVTIFLFLRYKNQSPSAEQRRKMAMLGN